MLQQHAKRLDGRSELFHNPKSPNDVALSEQMAGVIERTTRGLLKTAQPGRGYMEFVLLEYMTNQLYRLGERAPRKLIATTRKLLETAKFRFYLHNIFTSY